MSIKQSDHIGNNYPGTSSELNGCVNDAKNLAEELTRRGFEARVHLEATRKTITNVIKKAAQSSQRGILRAYFFSFSGHGGSCADKNGDEEDHKDETIYPADYVTAGCIVDDELLSLFATFASDTRITVVMDACHSGTVLDLPYTYLSSRTTPVYRPISISLPDIIMISGCRDPQESSDAWSDEKREFCGALTQALIEVFNTPKSTDVRQLFQETLRILQRRKFTQQPVLSSSKEISDDRSFFP